MPNTKIAAAALMMSLSASNVLAVEVIESIGAEKCGGAVKSYAVEFLAPEDTQVEARAKALRGGAEDARAVSALSLDGKPCSDGRCAFRPRKGQTYKLSAESAVQNVESLCISVARP